MIMFNDYLKLNKLAVFITSCLLALFLTGNVLFLGLLKFHTITRFFFRNRWTAAIPGVFAIGLGILLGLIVIMLFVTAIKQFIGKSRKLILMHRGRSYYLKFQLLTISISAVIITSCLIIYRAVMVTYDYVYGLFVMPPLGQVTDVGIIIPVFALCGIVALYYTIIYIIDIFANSKYRYQSIMKRNIAVFKFIIRVVIIAGSSFYLFISFEGFRVSYDNPYQHLLGPIYTDTIPWFVILMFIGLAVAIIVDYMCYFKKKVLV